MMSLRIRMFAAAVLALVASGFVATQSQNRTAARDSQQATVDITVHEGTSMAAALSPDKGTLAIDLQGTLWTLPIAGGAARRITDE
jgi:hypothetical protein